jgi:hypothetical protein
VNACAESETFNAWFFSIPVDLKRSKMRCQTCASALLPTLTKLPAFLSLQLLLAEGSLEGGNLLTSVLELGLEVVLVEGLHPAEGQAVELPDARAAVVVFQTEVQCKAKGKTQTDGLGCKL